MRKAKDRIFLILCAGATILAAVLLVLLLASIAQKGFTRLNWTFLTSPPSSRPARAGIITPLMGSLWVIALTGLIAVPIGVAAAIFLEEYTKRKNRFTNFLQLNISNLAGVPSIVYGLLGLAIFVRTMSLGPSILSGALTMALLILPMIIIVSQESLRAVPSSFREASLALGATEWQTIRRQVLPSALPGILTGVILALSRAIGETAPLIVVGAVTYIAQTPQSIKDRFSVLPIQIFDWTSHAKSGFHDAAGSAIIVLLIALLSMNAIAIILRTRAQKA